jgi:hypothetical protein
LPQFGKPESYDSSDLVTLMKSDTVYHRHNSLLGEEPAAKYKEWMVKHEYDPEKGKNEPEAAPEPATSGAPAVRAQVNRAAKNRSGLLEEQSQTRPGPNNKSTE